MLDEIKSDEFAYLYYRVSDKIIYSSHRPIYVNQIQIDTLDEIDQSNRFADVEIDRIEEFDAEVKLSFEGREKIKNVKMIDVFFKVQNIEESEKKQSVYDEIAERAKWFVMRHSSNTVSFNLLKDSVTILKQIATTQTYNCELESWMRLLKT